MNSTQNYIMSSSSNIMVVPRSVVNIDKSGLFTGSVVDSIGSSMGDLPWLTGHPLIDLLSHATFAKRADAETDESMLQIIPYITLVVLGETPRLFSYHRSKMAGEQRLIGKKSIGVGGHIEYEGEENPLVAYLRNATKELKEEVNVTVDGFSIYLNADTFRGIIFNDADAVGRVHLGVWHIVHIPEALAELIPSQLEDHLADAAFERPEVLEEAAFAESNSYEGWTQIVLHESVCRQRAARAAAQAEIERMLQGPPQAAECDNDACACGPCAASD